LDKSLYICFIPIIGVRKYSELGISWIKALYFNASLFIWQLRCFTDYDLKVCIKRGNSKITTTGRSPFFPNPADQKKPCYAYYLSATEASFESRRFEEGKQELALEDITIFVPENGQIRLQSIFREQRHIKARVKAMNLADHQIILEEI
jgi:predicted RNA-binding protein